MLKMKVYLPLAEVKKNEFATNENGIHILRLTKNNKRNLHISPRSSLTAGLIFMN